MCDDFAMTESPVTFSQGLPETVLPPMADNLVKELHEATEAGDDRHGAIGEVIKKDPTFLDAWARLSESARDDVEGYAYARIGYHRGLDALRKAGWRGNGYVRWREVPNQGFLRSLEYLRQRAMAIGETVESERCDLFLHQLDPEWKSLQLPAFREPVFRDK